MEEEKDAAASEAVEAEVMARSRWSMSDCAEWKDAMEVLRVDWWDVRETRAEEAVDSAVVSCGRRYVRL